GGQAPGVGALAGLRWAPFDDWWKATHVVLSAGWLRELEGANGGWARLALQRDIERLRLGALVHAEHVFLTGGDPADILVMAGASYAVGGPVRAGLEYVAQDLEESFGDQAEGGSRHFVSPQI